MVKVRVFFYRKKASNFNPKLESFLKTHENEIKRYGLEFPTEYVIIATK